MDAHEIIRFLCLVRCLENLQIVLIYYAVKLTFELANILGIMNHVVIK